MTNDNAQYDREKLLNIIQQNPDLRDKLEELDKLCQSIVLEISGIRTDIPERHENSKEIKAFHNDLDALEDMCLDWYHLVDDVNTHEEELSNPIKEVEDEEG